ncbi:cutinase family protein [Candidatus Nanosynbacter sp. BB002]|uniref:cutinase family protein n=1 Tax=Candidatus Nanosynbacter sp. BB002 TaxID=3393757 RepID=UPI0030CD834D
MKKRAVISYTLVAAIIVNLVAFNVNAAAENVNNKCTMVTGIFARGSGQEVGQDKGEAARFRSQLLSRIGDKSKFNFYELGSESYGGNQYPAVNVSNLMNGNAIGAKMSGGMRYDYGKSVDQGVAELNAYLTARHRKCPKEFFILGGYSQGAQVVGQTLPGISSDIKQKIVFTMLFGDPKLYLPEGEGILPPACFKKELSTYRREIANCFVDNGALGARKPFLPDEDNVKTGLWCLGHDYVCGSSKFAWDTDGHGKYANTNGPIDDGVFEAAIRLNKAIQSTPQDGPIINDKRSNNNMGTTGTDVVFVLDTTGSMSPYIDQMKTFIRNYSSKIKELNGRVGLVVYRDAGDEYTAKKLSDLQSDTTDLLTKLDSVSAAGGGDDPEAALHASMVAMNEMKWQKGATKAIILLTDAGYHEPDKVDGSTVAAVAKRSLEIDPVNVYPVVEHHLASSYTDVAKQTSGQVVVSGGENDTIGALTKALTKIKNRPNAKLKIGEYYANIGQEITFDASDSYVVDGKITKYEWDFDGDGKIDQTTTNPVASHVYTEKFDGIMQVRMSADNDTVSNVSAPVKVGIKPNRPVGPGAPQVSAKIIERNGDTATIRLNWQPVDNLSSRWLIRLDDNNLGWAVGEQRQLDITDVDISKTRTITVTGMKADGYVGKSTTVQIDNKTAHSQTEDPAAKQCPYSIKLGPITIACRYQKITFGKWSFNWIVWYIVRV